MSSLKENVPGPGDGSDVVKCGNLKKFKTMRKKFFVLRCESSSGPARLEYYDSEKKFRAGTLCKRTINLKACFNINKKTDSKQKYAIALYTRDDCFVIVADDENSFNDWLQELLLQQQADNDGIPLPAFEHVWQVVVKPKGLGSSKGLSGNYRLCLTATTVNLVKMNCENEDLEFPLSAIRRCGHSDCFFFMEVGRQSVTGTGEIWMQVEDTVIAQNIHEASLNAMRSISQQEEEMRPRSQSSGNTPETKPNSSRRQAATLGPSWRTRCESMPAQNRPRVSRSRIGSESEESLQEEPSPSSSLSGMPSSVIRPRTQSEGEGNHIVRKGGASPTKTRGRFAMPQRTGSGSGLRPTSMHRVVQPISNSPPIPNSPLSESPVSVVSDDRYFPYPNSMHASDPSLIEEVSGYGTSPSEHLLSRLSGRSRTPDSPTRAPIREESMEFTDEYMNMAPSGANKAALTVCIPSYEQLCHTSRGGPPSPEPIFAAVRVAISPPSPPTPPPPLLQPPPLPAWQFGSPRISSWHYSPPPDEDQSYMSMTPASRGSRGSSGYAAPPQTVPHLGQRSASMSGRLMSASPSKEDEGYMMMAPRQVRGSTGSRDGIKRGNTTEGLRPPQTASDTDQAYTMMQPIPKHHGNSALQDGTPGKSGGGSGGGKATQGSNLLGKTRASFSSPSSTKTDQKMKPSEILVRSLSDSKEPIQDTYMTMEFQPKKQNSPDVVTTTAAACRLVGNVQEHQKAASAYLNVSLPDSASRQADTDYTFMVPTSRPANVGNAADKVKSQSAVESLLRGNQKSETAPHTSEYMNIEFASKESIPSGELPARPMPPIPSRIPLGKKEESEYMNVEPGQNVRPHSARSPTSPPVLPQRLDTAPQGNQSDSSTSSAGILPSQSPSLSGVAAGRRAVDLKSGMDDLNLNDSSHKGPGQTPLTGIGSLASGTKSCEPSPGPPSRHSSCRSSQTSLVDRELNYIDVDVGQLESNNVAVPLERRARSPFTRRAADEDKSAKPTNYATIDFTKSEGLRTATSTRENRPL